MGHKATPTLSHSRINSGAFQESSNLDPHRHSSLQLHLIIHKKVRGPQDPLAVTTSPEKKRLVFLYQQLLVSRRPLPSLAKLFAWPTRIVITQTGLLQDELLITTRHGTRIVLFLIRFFKHDTVIDRIVTGQLQQ